MVYKQLANIGKVKVKTREEEAGLVKLAQDGCQNSMNELVGNNMKLVINIANNFQGCKLDLEDLVGEGVIGLHEAIKRFSPTKETKFTTYATYWAYNKIAEYVRRNGKSIRFPNYLLNEARAVAKYQQEYFRENQVMPTREQVMKKFGLSSSKMERIICVFADVQSLDSHNSNRPDTNLYNLIPDKPEDESKYAVYFKSLSELEREMLELNSGAFDKKVPYRDLAKRYDKSYGEVKKIIQGAKIKLKKALKK